MTETISVRKINEVHMKIDADPGILMEIRDRFTFVVDGHKFMAAYKNGSWDGKIRLFDYRSRTLYLGLLDKLLQFADARDYEVKTDIGTYEPPTEDQLHEYVRDLRVTIKGKVDMPRDYQLDAFTAAVEERRKLILCPTASGKSLIMYLIMRYFLETEEHGKYVIVVPTTTLVSQLYSDFQEYSENNGWSVEDNVHQVFSGQSKTTNKRVIITTWQSLIKFEPKFFAQVGGINTDEAHTVKAKSLTSILESCANAAWRIGTTGTLDGAVVNELVIEGLLGPKEQMITTAELMKAGFIADLDIDMILLDYAKEEREHAVFTYAQEIDFIESHEKRNLFITNVAASLKGNTLVLFKHVDHGIALHEEISKKIGERECHLVHGGIPTEERERIRKRVDTIENCVVVASYGTFSTGINMPEIHNLVFASPYKSQIKVLQSIGRVLRKSKDGRAAKLVDIADDLSWKQRRNYVLGHSAARLKIYNRERFRCNVINLKIQADQQ